jgi:hypothetical protein
MVMVESKLSGELNIFSELPRIGKHRHKTAINLIRVLL